MKVINSKITIHMVSSLDGFIAKKDGSVSWMQSNDRYELGQELTDEYIAEFLESIDCYVMGARTYEHALELGWSYGNKPVIVLSHKKLKQDRQSVSFASGNLTQLVNDKLRRKYQNIWMVGGSETTKEFLLLNLADKIVLTIIPVILGDGILFFDFIGKEQSLHLEDVTAYKDGMVELTYEIRK
ncbi:dihydrofolate reductase family protein [Spongiivirga sp. MCCC 1A20706]|uniref:dihydrofolate reductase family protein n=1 Tax=Spongiivirga sp. MCCC 1A20706 TaxID=3160963 RepID=UPI0039775A62